MHVERVSQTLSVALMINTETHIDQTNIWIRKLQSTLWMVTSKTQRV